MDVSRLPGGQPNRPVTPFSVRAPSRLPGMARVNARQHEAASTRLRGLPAGYGARRRARWLWRWRPAWLPAPAAGAAGFVTGWWPAAAAFAVAWLAVWRFTPLWDRSKMRRVGLAFRHRWDETVRDLDARAPDGEVFGPGARPRVRHQRNRRWFGKIIGRAVTVHPHGEIKASVFLPVRFPTSRLARGANLQEDVERSLRLPGGFGYPEWSVLYAKPVNASAWRELRVAYRGAPDVVPWGFMSAPDDFTIRVGCSAQGENLVDLLAVPHLRIYGPSRSGKGVLASDLAAQGVSAGWMVLIINCAGAPEWNPWDRHGVANVRVVRCSLSDQVRGANQFGRAMQDLLDIADFRDQLCDQHKVHSWAQLPDYVRRLHPRVLVPIDEPSALLKTAGKPGKEAGAKMEAVARTGAKYGITLVAIDQLVNVAGSAITGPTIEQMRGWCWVGEQPSEDTRKRIGGFTEWPTTPLDKGGAVYARFGTPASALPIRTPYHSPPALEAFLAGQRGLWP